MAAELAAGKSGFRRFAERLFDVKTPERAWAKGAAGEEAVGRRLARLPEPWAVVHDLPIGTRGANLDHLVLGPSGVFSLNTKHLSGRVTVYDRAVLVNGRKTDVVPKLLREAALVQKRLTAAAGQDVNVWAVLVVMGCELEIRRRPSDFSVVGRRSLPRWFVRQRATAWPPAQIAELERLARWPQTWTPARPRQAPARTPSGLPRHLPTPTPATTPTPPTPTPPLRAAAATKPPPPPVSRDASHAPIAAVASPVFAVREWQRYGRHRYYANTSEGRTLGWIDVPTGELHVVAPADEEAVAGRLRAARAAALARRREVTTER
ncbi:hypothetical protein GCM10011354_22070 [Egicoccus halophilus]|uniref:NERD domain-containing protein n=2 Tax=Egicoccus halophilus TaxID=1670830 RepID=A0A8J3EY29_9ACTN|nr:hypothetical protein GCM10011354_22070 [Egicoccus halophilus]